MDRKFAFIAGLALASVSLTGCGRGGGGGGGSITSQQDTQSVSQALVNADVVLTGSRSAQSSSARLSPSSRAHTSGSVTDALEESLVFDNNGNIIPSQCQVMDTTQSALGTITAISLAANGSLQETVSFSALNETDTITGTLSTADDGSSVSLQNGSDACTIAGTTETVGLGLSGAIETAGTPTSLSGSGLTPANYSGTVTASGPDGVTMTDASLSMTLNNDGTFFGTLTYTDASSNTQMEPITGQVNASGQSFGIFQGMTTAQNITIAFQLVPGLSGAVTASGTIFDGSGDLLVAYTGALTPS